MGGGYSEYENNNEWIKINVDGREMLRSAGIPSNKRALSFLISKFQGHQCWRYANGEAV